MQQAEAVPFDRDEMLGRLGGDAWVVKAQIHAGGRGKGGGVKVVRGSGRPGSRRRTGGRLVSFTILLTATGGAMSTQTIRFATNSTRHDIRVVAVDMSELAVSQHFADAFEVVPHSGDLDESRARDRLRGVDDLVAAHEIGTVQRQAREPDH